MPKPLVSSERLKEMIDRYRADLEEVDRRIRILEWLTKQQPGAGAISASSRRRR